MARSTETVRTTLEGLRPRPPRPRDLPPSTRPARRGGQGADLPALPPGRLGRGPGRPVRPDPLEHLPRHQRDARPAAPRARSSSTCPTRASTTRPPAPRSSARCPSRPTARPPRRTKAPKGLPPYLASLYEVPAPGPRAGSAPVPQDELPEVPGQPAPRAGSTPAAPGPPTSTRSSGSRKRRWRVKNQIIRANLRLVVSIAKRHVGPTRQLLRAGLRRQHVADPRRREVRLLAAATSSAPTPAGRS